MCIIIIYNKKHTMSYTKWLNNITLNFTPKPQNPKTPKPLGGAVVLKFRLNL